jgi:ParB family chromosome partitioning protein
MAKKKVFSIGSSLAESLEETFKAAHNYSGELYLDVIPLSKLEVDPENPRDHLLTFEDLYNGIESSDPEYMRKSAELESLQSLAHSINSQGVINPVTVYKYREKYRLIAGERRTLASILAGKRDIQARILDSKPDDLKISLLQWIENIERKDLSLWERLNNLEKILKAHADLKGIHPDDITVSELSDLIGCAKSHAVSYKAALNADDELKRFIFENKIKNLEKVALLAGIHDTTIRRAAIQACIDGANLKLLKTYATQKPPQLSFKSKPTETRGRQTTAIHFGSTKNIDVAKIIISSIVQNKQLGHLMEQFHDLSWDNPRVVADTFKQVLKKLEEFHA